MATTLDDFLDAYEACGDAMQASADSGWELHEDYPKAGFYVYALVDPDGHKIFYIGKGIGGRVLKHEERTRRGVIQNRAKVARIQAIYSRGQQVERRVLFVTALEEVALSVEDDVIRRLAPKGLTNIIGGCAVTNPVVRHMAESIRAQVAACRKKFAGGGYAAQS